MRQEANIRPSIVNIDKSLLKSFSLATRQKQANHAFAILTLLRLQNNHQQGA